MTVAQVFQSGLACLRAAGNEDAAFDCGCLFSEAFGQNHAWCITHAAEPADAALSELFFAWVQRRANGEPLQYILGKWLFCEREFFVGEGVLIPRPETEQLTELAVHTVRSKRLKTVVDLCAGSGCIGLTVALENPDCLVYLIEKYDGALQYLLKNRRAHKAENTVVLQWDALSETLPEICADLLLSNPPYIPDAELPGLQKEVQFEPRTALAGGADGLMFYRAIAAQWIRLLSPGGEAIMECGDGQGSAIASVFRSVSAKQDIIYDSNDIDRFVHITV